MGLSAVGDATGVEWSQDYNVSVSKKRQGETTGPDPGAQRAPRRSLSSRAMTAFTARDAAVQDSILKFMAI